MQDEKPLSLQMRIVSNEYLTPICILCPQAHKRMEMPYSVQIEGQLEVVNLVLLSGNLGSALIVATTLGGRLTIPQHTYSTAKAHEISIYQVKHLSRALHRLTKQILERAWRKAFWDMGSSRKDFTTRVCHSHVSIPVKLTLDSIQTCKGQPNLEILEMGTGGHPYSSTS